MTKVIAVIGGATETVVLAQGIARHAGGQYHLLAISPIAAANEELPGAGKCKDERPLPSPTGDDNDPNLVMKSVPKPGGMPGSATNAWVPNSGQDPRDEVE